MTLIVGTNQSTTNTIYTLAAGDEFILPASVVSQTTGFLGLDSNGVGHHYIIDGTLIGDNGLRMGGSSNVIGNDILTIGATGVVAAVFGSAVICNGGQATILNQGLVTGLVGFSFTSSQGTGSFVTNTGRVLAEVDGIRHYSSEKLVFTNTGTVTSFDSNSFNSISTTAVDVIINKGTMTGNVALGGGADTYEGNGGRVVGTVFGRNGNDSLRGGTFADDFAGGAGNDVLIGRGGKDLLSGGADVDSFFYYSVTELGDTITDFTTADYLRFKSTAFGNATIAVDHLCTAANFRSNLTGLAQDADDRFIFETDRDVLWFDANGTGAGGRFLVTDFNLPYDVNLTRGDIFIF